MSRSQPGNRNLLFLWTGQLVSQAGSSISQVAVIWLMLELTGSSALTGMVAFAGTAPALIFGLFAGVLVDRWDRRSLLLLGDGARGFLILIIPILLLREMLTPWILAILVFQVATFGTLFNPARDALIPRFTPPGQLLRVNALIQSTGYLAYFAGLFGAGLILGSIGMQNLFYLDSLTFGFSFVMVLLLRIPGSDQGRKKSGSPLQDLRQGVHYVVREDPRIGGFLLITALNNFFIMGPAIVGTPLLVRELWEGTGQDYAFVESTYGIGMLLGTFLVYRFARRQRKGTWLLAGLVYDGLTFAPLYFAAQLGINPLWATIGIIFIHSIGIPFIQVMRTTLIHSLVPGEMQGRVFSMFNFAVSGVTSLSVATTGILGEWLEARTLFLIIGCGAALTGLGGLLIPALREADE